MSESSKAGAGFFSGVRSATHSGAKVQVFVASANAERCACKIWRAMGTISASSMFISTFTSIFRVVPWCAALKVAVADGRLSNKRSTSDGIVRFVSSILGTAVSINLVKVAFLTCAYEPLAGADC